MENEKMTLFFSKRTGEIKGYVTGISNMDYYGDDKEDYSVIFDFIIVGLDDYVLNNTNQFAIRDGEIKLKENVDLEKYL